MEIPKRLRPDYKFIECDCVNLSQRLAMILSWTGGPSSFPKFAEKRGSRSYRPRLVVLNVLG